MSDAHATTSSGFESDLEEFAAEVRAAIEAGRKIQAAVSSETFNEGEGAAHLLAALKSSLPTLKRAQALIAHVESLRERPN